MASVDAGDGAAEPQESVATRGAQVTNGLTIELHQGVEIPEAQVLAALEAYRGQLQQPERFLVEWATYRLTVPGADSIVVGSVHSFPLIAGHPVFELRFENQLGLARIQPMRAGRPFGAATIVEIVASKFATPLESIRFTDRVLIDLFARQAPLPFLVAAPTGRLVKEARRPPNLLFAFHFLRRHGPELIRAVQAIASSPLRRLTDIREDVRLVETTDVDLDAMLSVLYRATHNDLSEPRIAHRLQPARVAQRRPVETLDIPENRFVLDVARRMAQTTEAVLQQTWMVRASEADQVRIAAVRNELQTFARDRRFREIGPLNRIPVESRVLQRRDGYRELTRLWFAFQRARQPMFDRLQHAIDLRDIATLYEYWAFFELIDQIGTAFGVEGVLEPMRGDGLAHGMACAFGTIGKLTYNASRMAYSSVRLRPDYLWLPSEGSPVAFDAKFRMTAKVEDTIGEEHALPPGVSYDPKDDDLVKMHAYRDALPVRAALVLYPGTHSRFRPVDGQSVPTTVADVVLNEALNGVGEIGMSPLAMGDLV